MRQALYAPGLGYYVNGLHKFGAAGDFVTAPELGGLFAQALAKYLDRLGEEFDDDWTLLELGPGSGALAAALLPALASPPRRYLMLEPSAALRQVQRERLQALPEALIDRVEWIARPPEQKFDGAVLANEVIDALPVERFRLTESGYEQLCVTVDGDRFGWLGRPARGRLAAALASLTQKLPEPLPPGYASEICLDLPAWLETVLNPVRRGLALLVDYGYRRVEYYHPDRAGGTLVCHYRHRAHFDPFVWPGLTDLSAFVDFTAAAEAARALGFELAGYANQAAFVLDSDLRDQVLLERDARRRLARINEFKRLVLPGEMGEKFKLLALTRALNPTDFRPADTTLEL